MTLERSTVSGAASGARYLEAGLAAPLPLLGGLSPQAFMRRYWHRKPLLVRQAWPAVRPPIERPALFDLAGREDVESRLIVRTDPTQLSAWTLQHGPFKRRALPPLKQRAWTLLVQGLDLHVEAAHEMLSRFRFVSQARLDDLMISYATDGGGVGPHYDAYDVFLVQVHGRRRWRIGRLHDDRLLKGVPLKILSNMVVEQEWVLEPGDMLYLPPMWAHDGVAEGECMTCSIGFRVPRADDLAREVLDRALDADEDDACRPERLYRDPGMPATSRPGQIPAEMRAFARREVMALIERRLGGGAIDTALGEALTEPKPGVWFEPGPAWRRGQGVRLHPRSRMMYDDHHVYLNGDAWRCAGADARLMRELADAGRLEAAQVVAASAQARALLADWVADGWLLPLPGRRGGRT